MLKLLPQKRMMAPELPLLEAATGGPVALEALRGYVVLLDFFSLADPHCVSSLSLLGQLEDHYAPSGLRVTGVHVPAYDFERPEESARREIWRLGVAYPVALDQTFEAYHRYQNRNLPARYLIDPEGAVRAWHHGPMDLAQLESAVRFLLHEAGRPLPSREQPRVLEPTPLVWLESPDLPFGANRAGFANPSEDDDDNATLVGQTRTFDEPPESRLQGAAYPQGEWRLGEERIVAVGGDCSLSVVFEGSGVRAIFSVPAIDEEGDDDDPATLSIHLNGEAVPLEQLGADASLEGGLSIAHVERGRLYELISSLDFGIHHLDLRFEAGTAVHLLSFKTTPVSEKRRDV